MDQANDSPGAAQGALDPLDAMLDRSFSEMTIDELMALNAELEARGIRIYNSLPWEVMPLSVAVTVYSKTFLETLAKHNAESLFEAVRTRFRKKDKGAELLVGPENDTAATLVITDKTPDEARLAVLDLDVTAEELRGKELRWDEKAMAWRPDDSQE